MSTRTTRRPALVVSETNLADIIPPSVLNFEFGSPDFYEHAVVDTMRIDGLHCVVCGPTCSWHDDRGVTDYSAMMVIKNDRNSFVQSLSCRSLVNQPVGTLLLLDVRKKHRLWNNYGKFSTRGVWAAITLDYHVDGPDCRHHVRLYDNERLVGQPPTIEQCEADMRRYITFGVL